MGHLPTGGLYGAGAFTLPYAESPVFGERKHGRV